MPPSTASGPDADAASSAESFKATFRRSCLDRARLVARKRRRLLRRPPAPAAAGERAPRGFFPPPLESPAAIVRDEMMRRRHLGGAAIDFGIGVPSPSSSSPASTENNRPLLREEPMDCEEGGVDDGDGGGFCNGHRYHHHETILTEEEFAELIEDVERELERGEDEEEDRSEEVDGEALILLEEELERRHRIERDEMLYLQEQIDDYERWREGKDHRLGSGEELLGEADEDELVVHCPICREANLLAVSNDADNGDGRGTTAAVITCPNHMNGSCPFRIHLPDRSRQHPLMRVDGLRGTPLLALEKALGGAIDRHAASPCPSPGALLFEVVVAETTDGASAAVNFGNSYGHDDSGGDRGGRNTEGTLATLWAVCPACIAREELAIL